MDNIIINNKPNDEFLKMLPKPELHLHLIGAIRKSTLEDLMRKYSVNFPAKPGGFIQRLKLDKYKNLDEAFMFEEFEDFLRLYILCMQVIREPEDMERLTGEVLEDLRKCGVVYTEISINLPPDRHFSMDSLDILNAINSAGNRVGERIGIEYRIIVDLVRDYGPEISMGILNKIAKIGDQNISAVDIGGSEHRFPPGPYREVYKRAREMGFGTRAHAGEAAGPESVREAIRELKVDRIGHGVRSIEDPDLVRYLTRKQIPLEVCPTSNIRTGVYSTIEKHPVRKLFDAGVKITLNSDDPGLFGSDILSEYQLLMDRFDFSKDEIIKVVRNGFESAFIPQDRKEYYLSRLESVIGNV